MTLIYTSLLFYKFILMKVWWQILRSVSCLIFLSREIALYPWYQDNPISGNKSGLKWYNEKNPINDTCNHISILVKQKYSNSYILFLFSFRKMYTFTLYIVTFWKLPQCTSFHRKPVNRYFGNGKKHAARSFILWKSWVKTEIIVSVSKLRCHQLL